MRKKANNKACILAVLLLAGLLLPGCKKTAEPPPTQPVPAVKQRPPVQKQATSAKTAGVQNQPMDFTAKKDPFKPFVMEPVQQSPKEKHSVAARTGDYLPIQKYEVSRFKVSGIIIGFKENTALVVDPEGKGYVVKEGMLMGSNDGRISRILPTAVLVLEPYRDDNGRIKNRTITLTLPKK